MINVTMEETGMWLDGSHSNDIDFSVALVDLAIQYGFDNYFAVDQFEKDKPIFSARVADEEMLEDLTYLSEDAIDFLNTSLPEGYFFEIQDGCLYLIHESQVEDFVY